MSARRQEPTHPLAAFAQIVRDLESALELEKEDGLDGVKTDVRVLQELGRPFPKPGAVRRDTPVAVSRPPTAAPSVAAKPAPAAGTGSRPPPSVIERPRPVVVPTAGVRELPPAREAVRQPPAAPPSAHVADSGREEAGRRLAEIAREVAACKACVLHETRTKVVPGQGNPRPEIMFIGEAPGADEDRQGLAFVGRAGQLLTQMISAMGFSREEVFIGNIAKCRPPSNRPPLPEEMNACIPFLKRQIAILKPKVIVALGATAVKGLLGLDKISSLRGKWLLFEGIDLMPTYHPAYLLRNPAGKKDVWADLQEVVRKLGRTPPEWALKGRRPPSD